MGPMTDKPMTNEDLVAALILVGVSNSDLTEEERIAVRLAAERIGQQGRELEEYRADGRCLSRKLMHWGSTIGCVQGVRHEGTHGNGSWYWNDGDEGSAT